MTRIAAFDLSKTATGFALHHGGDARPLTGWRSLGGEYTSIGRVYCNLHKLLEELHSLGAIDLIYYEDALDPRKLSGHTNIGTLKMMSGLAAHVESWAAARQVRRCVAVNQVTWRKHFIGSMRRGTKGVDLKDMAMRRARELGFAPQRHDEAEAIGILTYALSVESIPCPWEPVLREQFGRAA